MRLPGLSIYFACAAMLFPQPAAGQRAFAVELDVTVRRIRLRAKRRPNWTACFNATKAAASPRERNCMII